MDNIALRSEEFHYIKCQWEELLSKTFVKESRIVIRLRSAYWTLQMSFSPTDVGLG